MNVIIDDRNLTNIADAIRNKTGSSDTYKPSEMATAINSITTGSGGSTTKIGQIGFGYTECSASGQSVRNQVDFSVRMDNPPNLQIKNWKMLFGIESNGEARGVWRYDAKTNKCVRVNASLGWSFDDFFYGEPVDDKDIKDYFPSGVLTNKATTTHKCYFSIMEMDYNNQIADTPFKPIIWIEEE